MIVLDASVLIALLHHADAHHDRARHLLVDHVDDRQGVQVVTRADVLLGPARAGRLRVVERRLDDLGIRTVGLPASAAAGLASSRVRTGLRLPHCCVLLAAEQGAARVATFDARLARQAAAMGIPVVE